MAAPDTPVSFLPPEPDRALSMRSWLIAALVIAVAVGIAAVVTRRKGGPDESAARVADVYAASLPVTNLTLTEATNGAGGKATYIDGTIANTGAKIVTAIVVQVAFAAEDGTPPHRETLPLALVRTREPYVDLQPVGAAPVKPGERRDFRLIFEDVPANWDVKPPSITVVRAATQ